MFITKEDPRSAVKGSLDPLGMQLIWSNLGRHLIANLTTQSNSARGFTILVLGRYIAQRLIEDRKINEDKVVDVFLCFEQISAYVRHLRFGVGGDIRGIDRVRKNSQETPHRIPIGNDAQARILSNQRAGGLWGLFSVPARVSGLIEPGDDTANTPEVNTFIEEHYWPLLEGSFGKLSQLICSGGTLANPRSNPVVEALSVVLNEAFTPEEKRFYRQYLCEGIHVSPDPVKQQKPLAQLMLDTVPLNDPLGRENFLVLQYGARDRNPMLHTRLDQIIRCESVLAVAARTFEHILNRDGFRPSEVAQELTAKWGSSIPNIDSANNADLINEINATYPDGYISRLFNQCQVAFQNGSYEDVINVLIEWNKEIQAARKGVPWVQIAQNGCIRARIRIRERSLESADDLHTIWRHNFFLSSLQNILFQLKLQQ